MECYFNTFSILLTSIKLFDIREKEILQRECKISNTHTVFERTNHGSDIFYNRVHLH